LIARDLVARELIAYLGSVAMDEDDVPPRRGEIHNGSETRTSMTKLIADRRPLTWGSDRVPSERDDDRFRGWHGGAT
jgi:hypothetical protein